MLNLDTTILSAVVDKARQDAAAYPRWLAAIARAEVELVSNPYIARQDDYLLIASPSGAIYTANGSCQCQAYTNGKPCWHRAAARLVRLHDERQEQGAAGVEAARMETKAQRYQRAVAEINELFAY